MQGVFPDKVVDQLANLSFPYHFEAIQRGVIDLRDLVYFLSLMLMSLFISAVILDRSKA
jgi:ABC-2 type transport system permease protein